MFRNSLVYRKTETFHATNNLTELHRLKWRKWEFQEDYRPANLTYVNSKANEELDDEL